MHRKHALLASIVAAVFCLTTVFILHACPSHEARSVPALPDAPRREPLRCTEPPPAPPPPETIPDAAAPRPRAA